MSTTMLLTGADANILTTLRVLTNNLVSRPAAYGISQAEADHLKQQVDVFGAALVRSRDFDTRTPPNIAAKDLAKANAVGLARPMIQQIKMNQGVSVEDKIAAGIPLPRVGPGTPIGPPTEVPTLQIVSSQAGFQVLQFGRSGKERRVGKPYGTQMLNLFVKVEPTPSTDVRGARLVQGYTRNPIGVAFSQEENLKIATYWGCWVNPRGQQGPFSAPVSLVVAA